MIAFFPIYLNNEELNKNETDYIYNFISQPITPDS